MKDQLLKQINTLLPRSMAQDRFSAARTLQRLQRASAGSRSSTDIVRRLRQVQRRLQASADRRLRRMEQRPRFAFDPALPITAKKDEIIEAIRRHEAVVGFRPRPVPDHR